MYPKLGLDSLENNGKAPMIPLHLSNMLFAILGGIVCFLSYFYLRHLKAASRIPLPPGPPGEFLLGHLRRIPESRPEFLYTEWSKTYGEIPPSLLVQRSYEN